MRLKPNHLQAIEELPVREKGFNEQTGLTNHVMPGIFFCVGIKNNSLNIFSAVKFGNPRELFQLRKHAP
jgi:hypothetical protein